MRRAVCRTVAVLVMLTPAMEGCASTSPSGTPSNAPESVSLTRVGEAVRITQDAEDARECEYVDVLPAQGRSTSDADAMRALRNEGGRIGANLVLLVMETRTRVARAEGYLCSD